MAAFTVDAAAFGSGRHVSAPLGLVPRQDGTGGKVKLGPISKRGNGYLRRLLVNGAMSVLCSKRAKEDPGWSNCPRPRSARSPPARSPTRWRAYRLGSDEAAEGLPRPAARSAGPPTWASPAPCSPPSGPLRARLRRWPLALLGVVLTGAARGTTPKPGRDGEVAIDRTKKQDLRDTGLARVDKRDGIVGQPTDRGTPVTGRGATRPRGLDQTSIHGIHQGLHSAEPQPRRRPRKERTRPRSQPPPLSNRRPRSVSAGSPARIRTTPSPPSSIRR